MNIVLYAKLTLQSYSQACKCNVLGSTGMHMQEASLQATNMFWLLSRTISKSQGAIPNDEQRGVAICLSSIARRDDLDLERLQHSNPIVRISLQ